METVEGGGRRVVREEWVRGGSTGRLHCGCLQHRSAMEREREEEWWSASVVFIFSSAALVDGGRVAGSGAGQGGQGGQEGHVSRLRPALQSLPRLSASAPTHCPTFETAPHDCGAQTREEAAAEGQGRGQRQRFLRPYAPTPPPRLRWRPPAAAAGGAAEVRRSSSSSLPPARGAAPDVNRGGTVQRPGGVRHVVAVTSLVSRTPRPPPHLCVCRGAVTSLVCVLFTAAAPALPREAERSEVNDSLGKEGSRVVLHPPSSLDTAASSSSLPP